MKKSKTEQLPPNVEIDDSGKKTWKIGTLTYSSTGLIILFAWLLFGDFSWSMRDRSVGPMAAWYLKSLNVPNFLFGLILTSFPALIGLFLGPIISVKSDNHRGKWGRRIPFLMVTTPIAALGMIGIAFTPILATWLHDVLSAEHAFGSQIHSVLDQYAFGSMVLRTLENEMIVSVFCFAIFWTAFEFATIAGQAVFGGLINDVVPKQLIGRFYGLFRAVSLIDGIIFNHFLMGKVPDHFTLMLFIIGTFYGVAFMLMCFKVKEGEYPPPPPPDPNAKSPTARRFAATKTYLRECFANPYYLSVFLMMTIAAVSFLPVNAFAIPYATTVGLSMEEYGHCLVIAFTFSLCFSYFIGWLADAIHPLRLLMLAICAYFVLCIWGFMFANTAENFKIAFTTHAIISGSYASGTASIGQRLFPQAKFAQFASAAGIFLSMCGIALGPVVGTIIDATGNRYEFVFVLGGMGCIIALFMSARVYRRFVALGGPKNYVAPE